jgi:hypothetical protein
MDHAYLLNDGEGARPVWHVDYLRPTYDSQIARGGNWRVLHISDLDRHRLHFVLEATQQFLSDPSFLRKLHVRLISLCIGFLLHFLLDLDPRGLFGTATTASGYGAAKEQNASEPSCRRQGRIHGLRHLFGWLKLHDSSSCLASFMVHDNRGLSCWTRRWLV